MRHERLNYEGAEPSLDAEQLEALGAELDARLYTTAKAVCALVARSFGVTYTAHAMAKVLKRLGFVYKMPKKCRRRRTKTRSASSWRMSWDR